MSRALMIGILALLLGLLAVMANLVNPKPPAPAPPPDPAKQEQMEKQMQSQQSDMRKKEREMRQKEWQQRQQSIQKMEEANGMKTNLGSRKPNQKPPAAAPNPTAMDISPDWFKKRSDGEKGLEELSALQKQLEDEAKKAREAAGTANPVGTPQPAK